MAKKHKGRGRLNSIEQLPEECGPIIAWAADQLRDRSRTQSSIYVEFLDKCRDLQREHLGPLDFDVPSKSAFNRYSIRLAILSQRMDETRQIAGAIAENFDAKASDDLTLIAAEAIKTLIFEVLTNAGEAGIEPKGAMALANALRAANQAQNISTARRNQVEADFAKQVDQAVDSVAKIKGLPEDTSEQIKAQILGVEIAK